MMVMVSQSWDGYFQGLCMAHGWNDTGKADLWENISRPRLPTVILHTYHGICTWNTENFTVSYLLDMLKLSEY